MQQLKVQGRDIVIENQDLHEKVDQHRKGPIDINEWYVYILPLIKKSHF